MLGLGAPLTMIYSHQHWDQSLLTMGIFPKATRYFESETFSHCRPGQFPDKPYDAKRKADADFFHPESATARGQALAGEWRSSATFERALDFLGEGSLWVTQAPGHMAGSLVTAARLAGGECEILAGDCCRSK